MRKPGNPVETGISIGVWCPRPESNRYALFTVATDFKSVVSTNFTTRAADVDGTLAPEFMSRALYTEGGVTLNKNRIRADFLDTKFDIHIMRTSFFAGIAQLVERYLAKV